MRYDYFGNGTDKRLRLASVVQQNSQGDSLPPYKFEYVDDETLPPIDSNSMDFWGYYNGKTNGTIIPSTKAPVPNVFLRGGADRRPDSTFATIGLLKKITYPTGGHTEYTFESHDYHHIGSPPVTVIKDYPAPEKHVVLDQTFGQKDSVSFTINGTSDVLVLVVADLNAPGIAQLPGGGLVAKVTLKTSTGTILKTWSSDTTKIITENFTVSPDDLYLVAESNIIQDPLYYSSAAAKIEFVNTGATAINRLAGGVRIKKILNHDGFTAANDVVREFLYTEEDSSSGVLVNDLCKDHR